MRRIDGRSTWRPSPTSITLSNISITPGSDGLPRALVETSDGVRIDVPTAAAGVPRETLPDVSTSAYVSAAVSGPPTPPADEGAEGAELSADLTATPIPAIPADQEAEAPVGPGSLPSPRSVPLPSAETAPAPLTGAGPAVPPEAARPENWLDLGALTEIETRVARLSAALAPASGPAGADGRREDGPGSAAALVSVATVLWFDTLRAADRVAVTRPGEPARRAIAHLLDGVGSAAAADFATGPGTAGAAATIWSALARRRLATTRAAAEPGPVASARLVALLDATELSAPQIWEAVTDPRTAELGELLWVVAVRHPTTAPAPSGDRAGRTTPVPVGAADRYERLFAAAGWQVVPVRHGRRRDAAFGRPGGQSLRARLEAMSDGDLAALLAAPDQELRRRLAGGGSAGLGVSRVLDRLTDDEVRAVLRDLGGHDLPTLVDACDEAETERPTVLFVHTLEGWMPSPGQRAAVDPADHKPFDHEPADRPDPWAGPAAGSRAADLVDRVRARLTRPPAQPVPAGGALSPRPGAESDRSDPEPDEVRAAGAAPGAPGSPLRAVETFLTSTQAPDRLVVLAEGVDGSASAVAAQLGALGLTGPDGEPPLPVGLIDGPDAARAVATWAAGVTAGSRSVLVVAGDAGPPGSAAGGPDTGADGSRPGAVPGYAVLAAPPPASVPGARGWRPAFAVDARWCLAEALRRIDGPGGRASYLRLATDPVDDGLARLPPAGEERRQRRRQVLAGAYRLRDGGPGAAVTLAGCGAALPAVLAAADELAAGLGRDVSVICVTSPDLLLAALSARRGLTGGDPWVLDEVFPASRRGPVVTVSDGDAGTLALLAGIHGDPVSCLGAPAMSVATIVGAALDLLDELDG